MLSICIPVFNFSVVALVESLHQQIQGLNSIVEIVVLDDGSDLSYRSQNQPIADLSGCTYLTFPKNQGRSRIRNHFLAHTQYPWLLFMDCDSQLPTSDYVAQFVNLGAEPSEVICGGRMYSPAPPKPQYFLHWKYGSRRESLSAQVRNREAARLFMSNNFLMHRSLLQQFPFEEKLSGYGYEDNLMGFRLLQQGKNIRHIDNPLIHIGLETTPRFLEKTDQALANLLTLYPGPGTSTERLPPITLLRVFHQAITLHSGKMLARLYTRLHPYFLQHLNGKRPKLRVFDLYRLLKLCFLYQQKNNDSQR